MWYMYNGDPRVISGASDPKQTRFSHLPLIKSKDREMSGGAIKEFISVTPTPGRQWTNISETVPKVLNRLLGL